MGRILLCSTDVAPRTALAAALKEAGVAQEIAEASSFDDAGAEDFSAVVLDEPSPDQFERAARTAGEAPVFVLTGGAREYGGAAVFVKPFRFSAFLGTLIGALARFEQSESAAVPLGDWKFNPRQKTLTKNGETTIDLTDKETALLDLLRRAGAPVAKETLLRDVWGYGDGITTHTLETHIYRLRQKLENTGLSFFADGEEGYRLITGENPS